MALTPELREELRQIAEAGQRGEDIDARAAAFAEKLEARSSETKKQLADILLLVKWSDIARNYFRKSASWLYHKLDGIDGNGGAGGFTPAEKDALRAALHDAAERIHRAADNIR